MKQGYRECQTCGSTKTNKVSEVTDNGERMVWVRWECRDCGQSSEKDFTRPAIIA